MKSALIATLIGLTFSAGAFAQAKDKLISTLAVVLSPSITTIRLLDTTTALAATGSLKSLKSMAEVYGATIQSVESKGVNAKNELREESVLVIDLLANGQAVKMKDFRILAATIADLKNNEEAFLEIQSGAEKNQVSFEIMAVKIISAVVEN